MGKFTIIFIISLKLTYKHVDHTRLLAGDKIEKTSALNLKSETYEELKREAEEKFYNVKDLIEIILERHLKRNKMISRMWPGLQIARVDENTIIVINTCDKKYFDVDLRESFLYCKQDRSTGCVHTAFVWMQAEDLKLDRKF